MGKVREYGCKHTHIPSDMQISDAESSLFLKWKYSVGFAGDCSQCYKCFKKSNFKVIE